MIKDQVLPSSYLSEISFSDFYNNSNISLYICIYASVYIIYFILSLKKKNSYCKNDTSSQNKSRPVNVIMDRKLSHFKIVECCLS